MKQVSYFDITIYTVMYENADNGTQIIQWHAPTLTKEIFVEPSGMRDDARMPLQFINVLEKLFAKKFNNRRIKYTLYNGRLNIELETLVRYPTITAAHSYTIITEMT